MKGNPLKVRVCWKLERSSPLSFWLPHYSEPVKRECSWGRNRAGRKLDIYSCQGRRWEGAKEPHTFSSLTTPASPGVPQGKTNTVTLLVPNLFPWPEDNTPDNVKSQLLLKKQQEGSEIHIHIMSRSIPGTFAYLLGSSCILDPPHPFFLVFLFKATSEVHYKQISLVKKGTNNS